MISKSLEEYLKNIYVMKKHGDSVRVTDIAKKMNCTKPSVNKAIRNLKSNGLVEYEPYGSIEMTADGENLAKTILERYDIVYLFLKDVLNLEADEAEAEAEKIKLVMTDKTVNKLAKYVHEVLGLEVLDCDYDVNNERCRSCKRRTAKKNNN